MKMFIVIIVLLFTVMAFTAVGLSAAHQMGVLEAQAPAGAGLDETARAHYFHEFSEITSKPKSC
ncbi:MAG: hypothetical protein R3245_00590 [Kiloniellales bacterium]|nr:hypothetical protein [Kiloniellales bacterium]